MKQLNTFMDRLLHFIELNTFMVKLLHFKVNRCSFWPWTMLWHFISEFAAQQQSTEKCSYEWSSSFPINRRRDMMESFCHDPHSGNTKDPIMQ